MTLKSDKNILFRCDASLTLGGGHAMRCLALADAFAARGARCAFAVNRKAPGIVPGLAKYALIVLDEEVVDEAAALATASPEGVDLLVVDHYHRDATFETACRSFAREVLVIDDLADRPHDCDWLVDPTLGRMPGDYAGLVPDTCQLLLGPDYALLRPEFAALRPQALARRKSRTKIERILVSFGASDPHDMCGALLGPLVDALPDIRFDVVTGGEPSRCTQAAAERGGERVRLIRQTADMATLMAEADFAIGACGGTSWERCALGLPAAVVVTAENQRMIADALQEAGAAHSIRASDHPVQDHLPEGLCALLGDQVAVAAMAENAARLCDGAGTQRIVQRRKIAAHVADFNDGTGIVIRFARPTDEEALYKLQIEPGARRYFRSTATPSPSEHAKWYQIALRTSAHYIFVVEQFQEVLGVIRFFEKPDFSIEISIQISASLQNQGLGSKLLNYFIEIFPMRCLISIIHKENHRSLKLFKNMEFKISEHKQFDDFVSLIRDKTQ